MTRRLRRHSTTHAVAGIILSGALLTSTAAASPVQQPSAPMSAVKCGSFRPVGELKVASCINNERTWENGQPFVTSKLYVKIYNSGTATRTATYKVAFHRKPRGQNWLPWKLVARASTVVKGGQERLEHVSTQTFPLLAHECSATQGHATHDGARGKWSQLSHVYTCETDT